ncbi:hypothetical protein AKJ44_00440 [candidate division MSBL1 archaeon SCGC-AAA261F17]|uniref:Uncharacterized protein n=1 Tax=candidate division MSBL1 archaeon SCGC-AAA261F17 TaxID=1698274 RepID=A0A133V7T5_9EURY|nr:hypothetical protein AKJ44_00440 [candidate division MSBL1 archaeon SCGC-AAA261F17]
MKRRVQMSLDSGHVEELDGILRDVGIPRSTFVNMLIEDVNFVIKNIEDNPGYYVVERLITRLYSLGLIKYHDLVKTLGPERASEVSTIIRTVRKYKRWREQS